MITEISTDRFNKDSSESITLCYDVMPNGMLAVYAFIPAIDAPISFIWFRHTLLKTVEIRYVWTHEFYRRKGFAKRILESIKATYRSFDLATAQGNEMSIPWMKAMGFT